MARQHVFPVCGPDGRTFVPLNKKEGGVSITRGSSKYSETEDKDTFHAENIPQGRFVSNWFWGRRDQHNYLIDLTSAPDTDQTVNSGGPYGQFLFPWVDKSIGGANVLWEQLNGKIRESEFPDPGSIFCVGLKGNVESSWRSYSRVFLYDIYYDSPYKNTFPFSDGGFVDLGPSQADIEGVNWVTFMWTGTRFVFLGSNNWY